MHSIWRVNRTKTIITSICCIIAILASPVYATGADSIEIQEPIYPSSVIITEVQTGASAAGDEYVELYNTADTPVDITGWQVRYRNATTTGDTTLLATITPAEGSSAVTMESRAYYVLHTASIVLPKGVQGQTYTAKLSSADKVVALFALDSQDCMLQVQDAIAWGTALFGEGQATTAPQATGDRLVERYRNAEGFYLDTNHNDYDILVVPATVDLITPSVASGATPGWSTTSIRQDEAVPPPEAGGGSQLTGIAMQDCTLPTPDGPDTSESGGLEQPTEQPPSTIIQEPGEGAPPTNQPSLPAADIGLASPQVTELLPNPGSPLTDAADEFVELYNSNDVGFDLSGFMLESGQTTKKHYTFPSGTILVPRSFTAFFSATTHLGLSNTAGQVSLLDPFGNKIGGSDPYGTAKDNQSWTLANGAWYWTTTPTPNAANRVTLPAAKAKAATKKTTTSKIGAVKAASTTKSTTTAATASSQFASANEERSPLHTGVLALVGGFALLYGAYEYRSDMANKFHQLRLYREARREARQSAKGR